jgi:uncharacterized membrane protein YgdD (TMEM256/DUF423 family)
MLTMAYMHFYMALTAVLGASGVGLGAFGAHALKGVLDAPHAALWQTASQYHLLQAVALLGAVALRAALGPHHAGAWHLALGGLALGTVLFSGSLYALALGAPKVLGAVTPLGGLLLIAGWLALGVVAVLHHNAA